MDCHSQISCSFMMFGWSFEESTISTAYQSLKDLDFILESLVITHSALLDCLDSILDL